MARSRLVGTFDGDAQEHVALRIQAGGLDDVENTGHFGFLNRRQKSIRYKNKFVGTVRKKRHNELHRDPFGLPELSPNPTAVFCL